MSEVITCPQCGATVTPGRKLGGDEESVKMRCNSCGAVFEYIPGFGSFSISGDQQQETFPGSFRGAGTGDMNYGYEPGADMQTGAGAGTAIAVGCCVLMAFMLPLLYALFLIMGP